MLPGCESYSDSLLMSQPMCHWQRRLQRESTHPCDLSLNEPGIADDSLCLETASRKTGSLASAFTCLVPLKAKRISEIWATMDHQSSIRSRLNSVTISRPAPGSTFQAR